MKAWLSRLDADLSFAPSSPEEAACAELSAALPGTVCRVGTDLSMDEGYRIVREEDGSYTVWYKALGDKLHYDTEPESVTTVIADKVTAFVEELE